MIDPDSPDFTNTPASPARPRFGYVPADYKAAPLVSIITPFYNTDSIFHETAQTVLGQSLQAFEWLIINDGSTQPASLAILDTYRGSDPRIRIVDLPENQGLSAARNAGFREARTEYVLLVDSDDLLEPTAAEKWYWFLVSYPEFAFVKGHAVGFGDQNYLWNKGFNLGKLFLKTNLVDPVSMIRRSVHQAVGGYDEANRGGLEDWDFWLKAAHAGHWGGTIREYLDWYRRRAVHTTRWDNWDQGERQAAFHQGLKQKYARLWDGAFPDIQPHWHMPNDPVPDVLPGSNELRRVKPRLLMILPYMNIGGADKFNLDLLEQVTHTGWEVTIATTIASEDIWLAQFARFTPDIFRLPAFLHPVDYPRFLRYLIESRSPDIVLISHSELAYLLLPYLRSYFPNVTFADYNHLVDYWRNGNYARQSVEFQDYLDLSIVASQQVKEWMSERGKRSEQVDVCYINVEVPAQLPGVAERNRLRNELNIQPDQVVILYVARICPQKQPRVLAKTLRLLAANHPDFVAIVVGDGEDFDALQGLVKQYGLDESVRLLGDVPNDRVKQLMQVADIFFLPSAYEGIALSIYEAMSFGLSVVGAKVGGQGELVSEDCGFLIERSTEVAEAQQYANILSKLMGDPALRKKMGRAGYERVKNHFPIDRMGDRLLDLFEKARNLHTNNHPPILAEGLRQLMIVQVMELMRVQGLVHHLSYELSGWRGAEEPDPLDEPQAASSESASPDVAADAELAWLKAQVQHWQEVAEQHEQMLHVQQAWVKDVELGKIWLEQQMRNWQQLAERRDLDIQQQQAWTAEVEAGKTWLEEQVRNWQRLAESHEQSLREQQTWIAQLTEGKAWLESQVTNWRELAENRERTIQEQQAWIVQLEQGKAWLEQQLQAARPGTSQPGAAPDSKAR